MSYARTGAASYEGFNPGGPTGVKNTELPFDWLCTADATTSTEWYVPFYLPLDRVMEYWWRFRELTPTFSLTGGGFTFNRSPIMNRFNGVLIATDELDMEQPGILAADTYTSPSGGYFTYTATQNDDGWNGPGSTSDFTITCDLFKKQRVTVGASTYDIPHMIWQTDGALVMPSIRVTGSLVVTTPGTEYSWFFSTEPVTAAYADSVSIFPSHGGSAVDLNFSSVTVNPTAFSLAINPTRWWTHDGKWDEATGARL